MYVLSAARRVVAVAAAFLSAGLAKEESCLWILPPPLTISSALDELAHHGLDGSALLAAEQLHISSAEYRYGDGTFDVDDSLDRLAALPARARQLGYVSVRAAGGPKPFTSIESRQAFMRYEHQATTIIAASPMIALCCQASIQSLEADTFKIMRAHPQTLLRTHTGWAGI
ncbi:MAG: MEDS domain-containing protein [Nitrospira sp.]